MQIFSNYIQPISQWLYIHPYWALFFTFFISFTESLAIIGSIIPGSVTMTAIGIMAGSGLMRIDLTLFAAIIGAIAGDSLSYLLGYTYKDKLNSIWPFSKYPQWLTYGKDYFARHGGKSVLIGRFVGPLRSIIPVIAGMMQMSQWRFLIANTLSAIGWSCLYVLPGVLIGTASNELSPESATRLFISILLLIGAIWLLGVGLKWLLVQVNRLLRIYLHDFWTWSGKHPHLSTIIRFLTPPSENHHYQTTLLCIGLLFSVLIFLIISILTAQNNWPSTINQPVYLFLQSLRLYSFDLFFIACNAFISTITLAALTIYISLVTLYYRDLRTLLYWLSLSLVCAFVVFIMHVLIHSARPEGLLEIKATFSYPAIHLTFATAEFSALLFYLNKCRRCRFTIVLNILLPLILILSGIALIYLGDNWLMDVIGAYFCGFSISLVHWLLYRRQEDFLIKPQYMAASLLFLLFASSTLSFVTSYEQIYRDHQPFVAKYVFPDDLWWNQDKPILPLYRANRIGKEINIFNIQYAGKINHLENALILNGWQKQKESFFTSLIKRFSGQINSHEAPLIAQLYLNRKPELVMFFKPQDAEKTQILRIWRSNYHLKKYRQPIWLGTITEPLSNNKTDVPEDTFRYINNALDQFTIRKTSVQIDLPNSIRTTTEPAILLIRENP